MNQEPKVEKLLLNLEQLFVGGKNSDIILKVEDREFSVHKGILSVRSPVFACMFNHDTAEKFSGVVNIIDCSAEAFEVFLLYLYTGNVNTITLKNVFSVYYIADKYCVEDLKDIIIKFLINNISLENIFDVYKLSLRHSDSKLKEKCLDFIVTNMLKVFNSTQWTDFTSNNPLDVHEIFDTMLKNLKKKGESSCSEIDNVKKESQSSFNEADP